MTLTCPQCGYDLSDAKIIWQGWELDTYAGVLSCANGKVRFPRDSVKYLAMLLTAGGLLVDRMAIYDHIYPVSGRMPTNKILEVTIHKIRKEIEEKLRAPNAIKTDWGRGYSMLSFDLAVGLKDPQHWKEKR